MMKSIDGVAVKQSELSALCWSPLTDLFVEGMKASQPKSKFLFWFLILEELGQRPEFKSWFTPMFSPEERTKLEGAVLSNRVALQWLRKLLKSPTATVESRAMKMARIIESLNKSCIRGFDGPIAIQEGHRSELIKQRNNVAHRGSSVDEALLYNILFPLSRAALNYLLSKGADCIRESQQSA